MPLVYSAYTAFFLQSVSMSYEGTSEDDGVHMWVRLGDRGRYSVTHTCLHWWVSLISRGDISPGAVLHVTFAATAYGVITIPAHTSACCDVNGHRNVGTTSHPSQCFLISRLMNQGLLCCSHIGTNAWKSLACFMCRQGQTLQNESINVIKTVQPRLNYLCPAKPFNSLSDLLSKCIVLSDIQTSTSISLVGYRGHTNSHTWTCCS